MGTGSAGFGGFLGAIWSHFCNLVAKRHCDCIYVFVCDWTHFPHSTRDASFHALVIKINLGRAVYGELVIKFNLGRAVYSELCFCIHIYFYYRIGIRLTTASVVDR